MKRLLLVSSLTLFVAGASLADVIHERIAERDPGLAPPSGQSTLTGACTVVYYNLCSGWLWLWSGFRESDEIGVIFDLPNSCGKEPGEVCTNTDIWWYWRYTQPGRYGFYISYSMYEVDENGCKVGLPIGTLNGIDPHERWNHMTGLGSATADRVAIVATWDSGTLPYAATDNNASNANAAGCGGLIGTGNSVQFVDGGGATVYCPPARFTDGLGYIDLVMLARFTCETTDTETMSWGEIKSLFQ